MALPPENCKQLITDTLEMEGWSVVQARFKADEIVGEAGQSKNAEPIPTV
jgi:hypothetical protein